jgi:acyl-CoA thioesterase-1
MNRLLLPWIFMVALGCSGPERPAADAASAAADTAVVPGSAAPADAARPDDAGPVVVFLGTSLTAGLGLLRAEDTYVARVGELAAAARMPIRAVNAGVSGETSAGGLRRLDWVLREPVDILCVELGANDGLRGQDPAATEANLLAIVREARARHPDVRILIEGMEAPPNLGPLYTRRFRDIFPTVAGEADAALVPFLLEDVAGITALNQSDGIHPTPEGHRIMAHNVWPILEPLVRSWYADHAADGGEP